MENITNFIQKRFLNNIKNKRVKLYLINKCIIEGIILAEDNYCIIINPIDSTSGSEKIETNLIFKSAIVNISINEKLNIDTYFNENITNNKKPKNNSTNSHIKNIHQQKSAFPKSDKDKIELSIPSLDKIDKESKIEENKIETNKDYSIDSFLKDISPKN